MNHCAGGELARRRLGLGLKIVLDLARTRMDLDLDSDSRLRTIRDSRPGQDRRQDDVVGVIVRVRDGQGALLSSLAARITVRICRKKLLDERLPHRLSIVL